MQHHVENIDINIAEQIAFATDRRAVINKLLDPGSVEHALHLALLEQIESQESSSFKSDAVLAYITRAQSVFGRGSPILEDMNLRNAFLEFPTASAERRAELVERYLSQILPPAHAMRPATTSASSGIRLSTENALFFTETTENLIRKELKKPQTTPYVELSVAAVPYILENEDAVADNRLTHALNYIPGTFSAHPAVTRLVARSLQYRPPNQDVPRSFGTHPMDSKLTWEQLKQVGKTVPAVLRQDAFIAREFATRFPDFYPARATSPEERRADLERLFAFASEVAERSKVLEGLASPIMAYCMSTLLGLDGEFEFKWFSEWAKLHHEGYPFIGPTGVFKSKNDYFSPSSFDRFPAPNVWELSEAYLIEWYRREPYNKHAPGSYGKWEVVFREQFLDRCICKARAFYPPVDARFKSTAPLPEWLLSSSADARNREFNLEFERKRVELKWAEFNPTNFTTPAAVAAPLALKAVIKNVPRVTVRVFRLNALGIYRDMWQAVPGSIDLDGLVPHLVLHRDYSQADPLTRIEDTITIPSLAGRRGVFAVELEGAGQSVRAVIHKGSLSFLEHPTASGHAFKVFTEGGETVKDARVYLGTRVFTADPSTGFVIVPYGDATKQSTPIVLASVSATGTSTTGAGAGAETASAAAAEGESVASLCSFTHLHESYDFSASFVVDRESLRARAVGDVLIRVSLTRNGVPVTTPAAVASDAVLTVVAVDVDGVSATQTVEGFKLPGSGEDAVHHFSVQSGLASLSFTLSCKVTTARGGEEVLTQSSPPFLLNGIEAAPLARQQVLLRYDPTAPVPATAAGGGYVLVVVGKGGEPLPQQEVSVTLWHRVLGEVKQEKVTTDALGRVRLGSLADVAKVSAVVSTIVPGSYPGDGVSENTMATATFTPPQELTVATARANEYVTEEGDVLCIPYRGPLTETASPAAGAAAAASAASTAVKVTPSRFALMRTDKMGDSNITSALDCLSLNTTTGQLVFTGLKEGRYTLQYLPHGAGPDDIITASIRVLPANSRVSDSYVRTREGHYHQLLPSAALDLAIGAITGVPVAPAPAPAAKVAEAAAQAALPASANAVVAAAAAGLAAVAVSNDDEVVIQLGGSTVNTRVHVYSHHFAPARADIDVIASGASAAARVVRSTAPRSLFLSQRQLSGEQQYVRDRRSAPRQIGNMLPRPTLFLAKRFKQKTEMARDVKLREEGRQVLQEQSVALAEADMYEEEREERSHRRERREMRAPMSPPRAYGAATGRGGGGDGMARFARNMAHGGSLGGGYGGARRRNIVSYTCNREFVSLDFLSQASSRLLNLSPDAAGRVVVKRGQLGPHHTLLTVIAVDGPSHAVVKTVPLRPSTSAAPASAVANTAATTAAATPAAEVVVPVGEGCIDTRMPSSLSLDKHYTQRQLVTPLRATGATLPIADVLSARVEAFSSLPELWALFTTLDNGRNSALLEKFSFLSRWHTFSKAEKEEKFADLLCHELIFFIYCKDKAFFAEVVAPHVRNRHRKSVVDHYVLGNHARLAHQYSSPLAASTLNAFERVLVAHAAGPAAAAAAASALRDATPPVNPEAAAAVFASALKSRALALGPTTTEQLQEEAKQKEKDEGDDEDAASKDEDEGGEGPDGGDSSDDHDDDSTANETVSAMAFDMAMPQSAPVQPRMMMMKRGAPATIMATTAAPMMMAFSQAPPPPPAPCAMPAPMAPPGAAADAMGFASMKKKMVVVGGFEAEAEKAAASAKAVPRALFTPPDTTGEYEEREYFAVPSSSDRAQATGVLVKPSRFWSDWAKHLSTRPNNGPASPSSAASSSISGAAAAGAGSSEPFISSHILDIADTTFTEIVLAFAVTDLPAETRAGGNAASLFRVSKGGRAELVAPGPMFVLHEEEKEVATLSNTATASSAAITTATATATAAGGAASGASGNGAGSSMAVTQVYFDPSAATTVTPDGETTDQYVTDNEFLPQHAYGCRVVLTNVSPLRQRCQALLQIPVGSVPLRGPAGGMGQQGAVRTKTVHATVEAYSTHVIEYYFYFPALGTFGHYPVQVSRPPSSSAAAAAAAGGGAAGGSDESDANIVMIGYGSPAKLKVVARITSPPDTTSWSYIAANGTDDDVIAYLTNQSHALISTFSAAPAATGRSAFAQAPHHSHGSSAAPAAALGAVNPADIAWRCSNGRNVAFLLRATDTLRARGCYCHALWSQAMALELHKPGAAQQQLTPAFLRVLKEGFAAAIAGKSKEARKSLGPFLQCVLFTKDAHDPLLNEHQHLEYLPLINSRAHSVTGAVTESHTGRPPIQNLQLRAQYRRFVTYLTYAASSLRTAPLPQLLSGSYYLLLLDRVADAKVLFAEVERRRAAAAPGSPHSTEAGASPAAAAGSDMQLQLDYLTAYFDFYALAAPAAPASITSPADSRTTPAAAAVAAGPVSVEALISGAARARAIASKYKKYPVRFWRKLFNDVLSQIDEAVSFTDAAGLGAEDGDDGGFAMLDSEGAETTPAAAAAAAALASGGVREKNEIAEDRDANRMREMAALAATEPSLEMEVLTSAKGDDDKEVIIKITHAHLKSCRICFHSMDLESLFSTNPFLLSGKAEKFASVAPNASITVDLTNAVPSAAAGGACVTRVPVPAALRASGNLHIEVTSPELGVVRRATHFAHACTVAVTEGYGQVKVSAVVTVGAGGAAAGAAGRKVLAPMPGAYVKCFAKLKSGEVDFYKDGYTDLRGCFDYASLSTDKLKHVERFALLVATEGHGACVKEAAPPSR